MFTCHLQGSVRFTLYTDTTVLQRALLAFNNFINYRILLCYLVIMPFNKFPTQETPNDLYAHIGDTATFVAISN